MAALLLEYGFDLDVEKNELYEFILDMSKGNKQFSDIVEWLKNNCR
jgi:prophage maintenance system killer protein